jgi:hypothetical protein
MAWHGMAYGAGAAEADKHGVAHQRRVRLDMLKEPAATNNGQPMSMVVGTHVSMATAAVGDMHTLV